LVGFFRFPLEPDLRKNVEIFFSLALQPALYVPLQNTVSFKLLQTLVNKWKVLRLFKLVLFKLVVCRLACFKKMVGFGAEDEVKIMTRLS
jgi:hypothetical protein